LKFVKQFRSLRQYYIGGILGNSKKNGKIQKIISQFTRFRSTSDTSKFDNICENKKASAPSERPRMVENNTKEIKSQKVKGKITNQNSKSLDSCFRRNDSTSIDI